jgi:hypothetical protein
MFWVVLPGTETTSWSVPWMTTVAWVTPDPLTRSVMICFASSIWECFGVVWFVVEAVKTICWPPARSMPSRGVCRCPGQKTIAYSTATIAKRARK